MNLNHIFLFKTLYALCALALIGCSAFDANDESDYAPSVKQVAGCWISTENIGENRYFLYEDEDGWKIFDGYASPSKTCMEICIQENSTFTVVANVAGSEYYPDFSLDIYGVVEPESVSYSGVGGYWWTFFWSKRNVVIESDGDTTKRNFSYKENSEIRLNEGKLINVGLDYVVSDRYVKLNFRNESQRKYYRTDDKNACKKAAEEE